MKSHVLELLPTGKNATNTTIKVLLLALTLILLIIGPICLLNNSHSPLQSPRVNIDDSTSIQSIRKCDMFSGKWVPHNEGPYYTNATCQLIIDQQNCMKFGRPDTEFLKWRWKPHDCELPVFNAVQFLKLVSGKSLAFLGDSVARNQMQSLLCLLSSVVYPVDISYDYTTYTDIKRWFYSDYSFTLAAFWSPFLVQVRDADPNGHSLNSLMSLNLDKANKAWAAEIEDFDYVIISAGQWFFRPLTFYENGQIVGCHACHIKNITGLTNYYGYRMAFRTAFKTLMSLKNYKGVTILRTFSPAHFENGEWNKGGNCVRRRPFREEETKLDGYIREFYLTQKEEYRVAARQGRKRGFKFMLLDTTVAMLLRPDGHPNHYGHSPRANVTIADCVHWCLPGPIDTWNEFLLQMLIMEHERAFDQKLPKTTGR